MAQQQLVDNMQESQNLPAFLDEAHFADVLKGNIEKFSEIKKMGISPATKAGDNYGSQILRITTDVLLKDDSVEKMSFILKLPPRVNSTNDLQDFFVRESIIYDQYLPEFEQLFKEAGSEMVFAPKFYKLKKETNSDGILLEDLCVRNFENVDRMQGLDQSHTEFVLRKLSQFHAASAKRFEIKGAYPELFQKSFYSGKDLAGLKERSKGTFDVFMECVPEYCGSNQYQHKIVHMLENFHDLGKATNEIDTDEFNVLNYGDCWINNIMFQHDETGNIKDMCFIDFQICKYGSPAHDLYYFLLSSTHLDIKVTLFDYFINYYHQQLLENLKLLKYMGKQMSLEDLNKSLRKYAFRGFSTLMGVCSACFIDPSEARVVDKCVDKTAEDKAFRKLYYGNDKYKAHAGVVLSWLNGRELLDF